MPDLLETIVGLFVVTIVALAVVLPTISTQIGTITSTVGVTNETFFPTRINAATNLAQLDLVSGTDVLANYTNGAGYTRGTDYSITYGDAATNGKVTWLKYSNNITTANTTVAESAGTFQLTAAQKHPVRNSLAYNSSVFTNFAANTLTVNITNNSFTASTGSLAVAVNGFHVGWVSIPAANTSSLTTFTNVSGSWISTSVPTTILLVNATPVGAFELNGTSLTTSGGPDIVATYRYYPNGYVGGTIGNLLNLLPLLIGLAVLLLYVGLMKM